MATHPVLRTGLAAGLALALAGCFTPGPRERDALNLALYSQHAGDPVDSFHMRSLRQWVGLGDRHIALYTAHDKAWLIEVDRPCPGLEFAQTLKVDAWGSRVHARFASVRFEHQSCRIREIRPVDVRALREQRRAQSAASA